jgi:monoamine oxidase
MALTRRTFLTRIGQVGGFSAAFVGMQALGLMPAGQDNHDETTPIAASSTTGNGIRVAILGGGIAGLVAAYELRAQGYTCTILEARSRPGGRNWTVRNGDTVNFLDGTTQSCTWDPGHYQNFGPARLPSTHKNMLGYCKTFGVALEVEINTSRSSYLQSDSANGGQPIVQRQAINDTRGHVSELLSKCVNAGALDQQLTQQDHQRMLDFLRTYGPLDRFGHYVGSDRAGYSIEPGAGNDAGSFATPISMHTLLDENFWEGLLYEESNAWQATMFQPVGGMDRIPYAFAQQLGDIIRYNSIVTELHKTSHGVRIGYTHDGAPQSLEADFCFCALPLVTLRKTANDLSAPYRKVIDECTYSPFYKIAWESRRFWEQDYHIYGGLEFRATGLSPIWFPSSNLFTARGVFVSGYDDASAASFHQLTLTQKLAASRDSVEHLHPGHGRELEKPLYVNWGQIPWNEGAWIGAYGPHQDYIEYDDHEHSRGGAFTNPGYATLLEPDGPIYFVGDHVSYLVGWQEGAALSSLRAIRMLNERIHSTKQTKSPT